MFASVGQIGKQGKHAPRTQVSRLTLIVQSVFQNNNYNGALYDYPNISSLYNNSTGTIPVAAVTDPVGFSADSRLGLVASTKGVYLSGATGTYLSSPDSVAASITGDIDISAEVAMTTWTPASTEDFVAKYSTAPNLSFVFGVGAGGALRFLVSTTGSNNLDITSTAGTGFAAGTKHFIRVTRQASSGAINFYTSSDGISWTQLGTTVAGTAGNIFDGTAPVTLSGYNNAVGESLSGKLYSAKIRNGIAGTLAVNYNGTDYVTGSTLTSSTTGEIWTLNGAAYIAPDGNHALQATAGARPTWSNRVNIAPASENLTALPAYGTPTSVITTVDIPTGASSATSITTDQIYEGVDFLGLTIGTTYTARVTAKGVLGTEHLIFSNSVSNLLDQTITTEYAEYSVTFTATQIRCALLIKDAGTIKVSKWQFELGTTATRYQRVTTATDFDTAGFPYYLSFLGTDDSLTSATGGGGSAGLFWCGVVQPTAGAGTLRTLFADNGTNTGYKVQLNTSNKLSYSAGNNTAFTTKVSTATVDVGTKYLLTVWDDGTNLNVQINSAAVESVARPVVVAGTAGYTIGKDNGAASSYSIANIYSHVYFKDTGLTAAQRAAAQAWARAKGGL